jgi:hypothetical protein
MKSAGSENPIFKYARGEASPGQSGMSRRQMVQRLLSSAGGSAAFASLAHANLAQQGSEPPNVTPAGSEAANSTAPVEWSPQFLDAHQNETVIALAERIVPGSTGAQVNRTIDLLLSVETQQNQRKFFESLSAFDAQAIERHRQPFVSLTAEQQNSILTVASTANSGQAKGDSADSEPGASDSSGSLGKESPMTLRDHFENIKDWVVKSYYSSEVGLKDLGWTGRVMWDSFEGCQHPDEHQ